jgi:hypothetical protein
MGSADDYKYQFSHCNSSATQNHFLVLVPVVDLKLPSYSCNITPLLRKFFHIFTANSFSTTKTQTVRIFKFHKKAKTYSIIYFHTVTVEYLHA